MDAAASNFQTRFVARASELERLAIQNRSTQSYDRIFLADSEEVCEDNLEQTGISFRFENADFEDFVSKVCSYMVG